MNVISTSTSKLSTRRLDIGFEGENERTQVRIDATKEFTEYPQASPTLAVKPGFGEEVYPVIVTKEGNEVVWLVTQNNLDFTGDGEIQLNFVKDSVICKTVIGKIHVDRSLIVNVDPPEHIDTWYDEATAKLADVDEAVNALEAIDAIASGLPAGSDPTVTLRYVEALGHKRFTFQIPKGDRGERGATGNGIRSISQSGSTGLYKKYTIHFTDGNTTTFQVRDGDRGLKGDTGATPDISIGTVETLPAGSEATASMSGTAENPLLNLGIPKGDTGEKGDKGDKGDRGATPIFSMGAVTNLPAGTSATATITGTAEEPVLNLGIPKGDKGDKGDRGERGPQGIQGIQGDRGLTGPRGEQGLKGDKGETGATGATGATPDFSIGAVSTLPAGSSATAEITGTAENPVLSLGIPQGAQGVQGVKGPKGDPGDGVPAGGITGQVLAKASDTDRDTEWIHVAPVIKNTASGSIASFPDGADGHPIDELKVSIEPVQDLHGYDHPWPAGGGKNLLDINSIVVGNTSNWSVDVNGDTLTVTHKTSYTSGTPTFAFNQPSGTYVISIGSINITGQVSLYVNGSWTKTINNGDTFTIDAANTNEIKFSAQEDQSTIITKIQIESGSTATSYVPYSNICPITGWTATKVTRTGKNLLGGLTWGQDIVDAVNYPSNTYLGEDANGKYVEFSAGYIIDGKKITNNLEFKDGVQYSIVLSFARMTDGTSKVTNIVIKYTDNSGYALNFPTDPDTAVKYKLIFKSSLGKTVSRIELGYYSGTTRLYYEESGIFEGDISADDFEPYQGNTYDITLPTEAGTVYGGELTVNADGSGSLVVDRAMVDLGTLAFSYDSSGKRWQIIVPDIVNYPSRNANILAEKYAADVTAIAGDIGKMFTTGKGLYIYDIDNETAPSGSFVYPLATPITYTLTASQIRTLLGTNNVWSDAGDVSVKYNADTKLYIDNKITQAIAAALNS